MKRLAALLMLLCAAAAPAFAHSMYQAAVLLDFHAHSVEAELQLPQSRIDRVLGPAPSAAALNAYLLARFHLESPAGQPWRVQPTGPAALESIDGAPYLVAHLLLEPPAGVSPRAFTLADDVLLDTAPGQVTLVSVRSDWSSSTFANEPDLAGVLSPGERTLPIDRGPDTPLTGWTRGFRTVFRLGTRHIAEGTDHLLFLFALLLPAPLLWRAGRWTNFGGVRHGVTQILKVVTAFTLGHSLTLALAASGVVRVPEPPIEVLIALSILVSALHAARPLFPGREALIAGSFGLIHGLAFASTLAELGLHRWERVWSIFAFNVGIEAMQLLVVLCVMPSLMLLSRTRFYPAFRMAGAVFAGCAALGWALDRSFGWSLPVDRIVDAAASHAVLLAAALFVVSAALNLRDKQSKV